MPPRFSFNTDLTSSVNAPLAHFASLRYIITRGVCHTMAFAIYIKKYLKAKERRIMETQIFHQAKI
jgi:hypothetical protein